MYGGFQSSLEELGLRNAEVLSSLGCTLVQFQSSLEELGLRNDLVNFFKDI